MIWMLSMSKRSCSRAFHPNRTLWPLTARSTIGRSGERNQQWCSISWAEDKT
uniref:Uncharacterized protein n=1 Tax=Arundo donax TaxID=35708 RepID=A0A0A9AJE2_ARUDO